MMLRLTIALVCLLGLAPAATALAKSAPADHRPTFGDGQQVMHRVLDDYANGVDGELTLGVCRRHATRWIVCRARIDRKREVVHYRFKISARADGWLLVGSDIATTARWGRYSAR